jgi:oxygen-independent coproporphyrinogen-3 oxidase
MGSEIRQYTVDTTLGVYVHIPFCSSKCPYCDFNSAALRSIPEARYVGCLLSELARRIELDPGLAGRRLKSVYLGGGTPTTLSPASIREIIVSIKDAFAHGGAPEVTPEITIEANPARADRTTLAAFREAGVNRISVGVQSFDDSVLKTLGRAHTSERARAAVIGAREAGFTNIGLDLIFAVPGQSVRAWGKTLDSALELRPHHISLYNLTIERSTPFYALYGGEGSLASPVSEEVSIEMYSMAAGLLKGAGYRHYEISNFALEGSSSVHNAGYWSGRDYIGLGAGAHSYMSSPAWGRRFWNESDRESYMRSIEAGEGAVSGVEELTRAEARAERVMLGLRMLERGIDALKFERRFGGEGGGGIDSSGRWRSLERDGLVHRRSGALLLTPKGVLVSDTVIAALA